MPKFNVTLLPVIAVKMIGIDAENPAHAVQVARTMLGGQPFYWMERNDPAPGVHQTYDNEEIPYVLVDTLKDDADPTGDPDEAVDSSLWFMVSMPHDMGEIIKAALDVVQQAQPAAMVDTLAGTPMAAAVHNLRVTIDALPPLLPPLDNDV